MPIEPRRVDFSTGQPVEIVRKGQRINGLMAQRVPRGLTFGVKFGNNPVILGYSGKGTWTFGPDTALADVTEGVEIHPTAPAPGQSVDFTVSYGV
ncbi:MAG: hypothetical protein KF822_12460 [Steroidobacteraceae bacterium]|nr:hypothetical protein [Steroidobacteraceae bacterium]